MGFLLLIAVGWLCAGWAAADLPRIDSPVNGQALQGSVAVRGYTLLPGFQSAELYFGYEGDPTNTWFLIQTFNTAQDGDLASWDTSTLTDGNYRMRLVVLLQGGTKVEAVVTGLRVRNYTAIETAAAPLQPANQTAAAPTATPAATAVRPTPTALPPNPAEINGVSLTASLTIGAALAALALLLVGIYLWFKNLTRK